MRNKILSIACCLLFLFCIVLVTGCRAKFVIKFVVDSEVYDTINTNGQEIIKMPQNPTKEGYTFEGWYWDKDVWRNEFTARSLLDTPLSSSMEVYAHFVDETYLSGTNINIKGAVKLNVDGIGEVFYLVQSSNQLVCKLEDYVECNPKTSWILSRDLSANNPITSKTIELQYGDNPLYYIYVTDKDEQHNTFIVLIHRNVLYNVTFNTNGGSPCETLQVEEGEKIENIPTTSKKGYTFVGWNFDFSQPIKSNVTINAKWTANDYKVSLNVNGGAALETYQLNVTYNKEFSLPTPTKKGYRFDGWYSDSTRITNGVWRYTENMSLVAQWSIIDYTIIYDLDGGSASSITLPNTYTILDVLELPSPDKLGYDFAGWSTTQDGTGIVNYRIERGTTSDLKFYAKWEPKEYVITYNVNGGDSLSSSTQKVEFGKEYELVVPTRLGYGFDGWYKGQIKIDNGTWSSTQDVSLTAHWKLLTYTITYHLYGAEAPVTYPSTYTVNDLGTNSIDNTILNNLPSKTGYSLGGVFSDYSCTKSYETIATQTTVGNKDVYFKWNPNKYEITLDVDGGSGLESTKLEIFYDSILNLPTPIRDGYSFKGWFNGSEKFTETTWKRLENVNLTAKWELQIYRITYVLDGGVNDSQNPSTYTYISNDITLNEPLKTGYEFLGWTSAQISTPSKIIVIDNNSQGDVNFTANWKANTYKIIYDVNGGDSLTSNNQNVVYDNQYTLVTPTRPGYTFKGWYLDSTLFESGTWSKTQDVTLKAKWEVIAYTISYELNGGTVNNNPSTYTYDDEIVFVDPQKEGYTFTGWYNNSIQVFGISVHSTGNIELQATWDAVLNNLNVESSSASKGNASIIGGSGYTDEIITVQAVTKENCVFVGWFDGDAMMSTDPLYSFTMPKHDYCLISLFLTNQEYYQKNKEYGLVPNVDLVNMTATLGLYPNEVVLDEELIASLDANAFLLPNGLFYYGDAYYYQEEAHPNGADTSYADRIAFNDGTLVVVGKVYWFKCKPIKWHIMSSDDYYYLLSDELLDAHCIIEKKVARIINGQTIWPNNYEYSDVRAWLNNDFYDLAFGLLLDEYVIETLVDNSVSTTNNSINPNICNDTLDKVFMPSYQDYVGWGFGASELMKKCTDFAIVRGIIMQLRPEGGYFGYCSYWTRSPNAYVIDSPSGKRTFSISVNGILSDVAYDNETALGIRPAIKIEK